MKKVFAFIFALACFTSMNADELYLVGDGTPIGWEGDGNMRQTTRMTETSEGVYVWTGLLKHGGEGFKICNSFGGWDGYHPSSENYAIADSGTDTYTTSGNDWKWNPANTDWQYYTITLDKNAGTLSWEPATPTLLEPVDGVISIGTAAELSTFAFMTRNNVNGESYNVKLTADIDYTAYKNGSMSAIGVTEKFPFKGEFDGQNHTITVDLESYSTRFSLFGTIQGKVHNLKIDGKITATNKNQTAGICGLLKGNDNKIYNSISAVEIVDAQNGDGTIAGICAVTYDVTSIENCAFFGKISAPNRDGNGGVVAWANSGASTTIKNCLVVADINWAGGADFGRNNPSVINTYKTNASDETLANGQMTYKLNNYVSGAEDWFQTLGTDVMPSPLSSSAKLYANGTFYCDGVTSKGGDVVLGNTNESVIDPHVFGEDGICTGCHAVGQEAEATDGVYQITNAGNLLWWAQYVNAGNSQSNAVLTANVDLSAAKYVPAGTSEYKYAGSFDGQGHAVTLALNNPSLNYQGLFGVATDGATIKNVVVKGTISGNSYVAGIVGGSNGSVDGETLNIINCGNEATITAANANGAAIIGVNMGGAAHFYISNCYNVGNVTSGREAGAITGWTGGDKSTIENTYNIGVIKNGEAVCTDFVRGGGNLVNTYDLSADDAQVASGELCVKLGAAFRQNLGTDAYPVLDATHNVVTEITEAGYSTLYVENADLTVPAGVTAFTAQIAEKENYQYLELAEVGGTIPASTPVILKGAPAIYEFTLAIKPTIPDGALGIYDDITVDGSQALAKEWAAPIENNVLKGAAEDIEAAGKYVLAQPEGMAVCFYQAETGIIKAGKAYLEVDSDVKAFFFSFDDATGIEAIDNGHLTIDNEIFNLAGQRVGKMQKGINIINGKKILK